MAKFTQQQKLYRKIQKQFNRATKDYSMFADGDKILVALSGGKDSLTLLCAMAEIRRFYPKKFDLLAITVDMGCEGMDFSPVKSFCEELGVEYEIVPTQISKIIFDVRKEKNPCSLCAKMRRGALYNYAKERGCNKVALGHHYDDAVETFLLSLFYEGRISCFEPVTYLDRTEVTQIRPMLYLHEKTVDNFVSRLGLPVIENRCPVDKHTKREEIKQLVFDLSSTYPDLKERIFGAMQRLPLPEWEPQGRYHRPKDEEIV